MLQLFLIATRNFGEFESEKKKKEFMFSADLNEKKKTCDFLHDVRKKRKKCL